MGGLVKNLGLSAFFICLLSIPLGLEANDLKIEISKEYSDNLTAGDNNDLIAGEYGSFRDPRDGKVYKTVRIGSQVWMAENLNYATGNSWCYDNNSSNCKRYGRLYDWETARRACPTGWRLPSDGDWTRLVDYLRGDRVAGTKMKSSSGWEGSGNGTNESGFSGLPGGSRYSNGTFGLIGKYGYWWSSTENDSSSAWYRTLYYSNGLVTRTTDDKVEGLSVRCFRD